jgi:MFS family permease
LALLEPIANRSRWRAEAMKDQSMSPPPLIQFRPFAAWATVFLLIMFVFISYIDRQIVSLLVEPIKHDLGLSDTQISLVQGIAFALFYSCAGVPLAMIADRYSRRLLLFSGIVIFSLASAACGLMRSFEGLFAARLIVGIGEAVLTPIALSIISENFPRDKLGKAMGVFSCSIYIGFGGALIVVGAVMGYLSGIPNLSVPFFGEIRPWQATFLVTALPAVPLAFLAFTLRDPRDEAASSARAAGMQVKRLSVPLKIALAGRGTALAHLLAGFASLSVISYVTLAWTPAFFVRRHDWDVPTIGLWFGVIVLTTGISGSLLFGNVISRLMKGGRNDACFTVPAISCMVAMVFFVVGYLIDSPWGTLACIGVGYFGLSAMGPAAYTAIPLVAPVEARARVSSFFVFTIAIAGAGLGPLFVASITDYVLKDEMRLGESLAIVIAIVVPLGSLALFTGRSAFSVVVDMPERLVQSDDLHV